MRHHAPSPHLHHPTTIPQVTIAPPSVCSIHPVPLAVQLHFVPSMATSAILDPSDNISDRNVLDFAQHIKSTCDSLRSKYDK